MAPTIHILGTDPEQCKEVYQILREHLAGTIVKTAINGLVPETQPADTVVIAAEETESGVLYRQLLNKLVHQGRRAEILVELVRLFSSSVQIEDILERVVAKSTELLGDTAFIVLNTDGKLRLEAAYSTDRDRLIKMLITTLNTSSDSAAGKALREVLEKGNNISLEALQQSAMAAELQPLIDKYTLQSLMAIPIRTGDKILGVFISLSSAPRTLGEQDLATATALSDFTAAAIEHARLFAEIQRSAITDSLTGAYNTRFFHDILAREAARSHRYGTELSLLMIDVDAFKIVNDTFGHLVGDKVLSNISRIIEKTVRNTDFVCRCGGDEFSVVLPGTGVDGAIHVAEKILKRVETSQILQTLGYY